MTRKALSVVLLLLAALSAGCNARDWINPTGPSGFDSSKPIGRNNRPPGPGPSVRASVDYGVYDSSGTRLEPIENSGVCNLPYTKCETYALKQWTMYSTKLCVAHPGVPGRRISMFLAAQGYDGSAGGSGKLEFDEGDPSRAGTVCLAVSFNPGSRDKEGTATVVEYGQDIIDASEQLDLWTHFYFQVR